MFPQQIKLKKKKCCISPKLFFLNSAYEKKTSVKLVSAASSAFSGFLFFLFVMHQERKSFLVVDVFFFSVAFVRTFFLMQEKNLQVFMFIHYLSICSNFASFVVVFIYYSSIKQIAVS